MNTPKLRFKEFSGKWLKVKLGEVTTYTKGYAFKSYDYQDFGVRIIRVSDLSSDNIKMDIEKKYISEDKIKGLEKFLINQNEIIITTVGSKPHLIDSAVGRGIFVDMQNCGILNQNLLKINVNVNHNNRFLFSYINTQKYISFISDIQRGNANQSNITVADLFEYELYIPSLPEQQKIASFFTAVDQKLIALKKKKELLEQYKKGVMQQIFSQKVRFKDENGNPFPEWEERKLGEIINKNSRKNKGQEFSLVQSVSNKYGFINQEEYFEDRRIASKDTSNYYIIDKGTFAYNPSRIDVGSLAYKEDEATSIISPLYISFTTKKESVKDFYLLRWFS